MCYPETSCAQRDTFHLLEAKSLDIRSKILKINIEMEDSATACILDLPPELVVDILTTLDIYFDFDIGGTNGLVAIPRQPELCQHVHTVELRRRDGLRSFDDTDAWRAATVYEYAFDTLEDGDVEIPAGAMTHDEWVMLPDEAVQKLYDAYESDRQAVVGYTSRLSCALSAIVYDIHDQTQTDVVISGAHETLADFGRAIARLSSASHFVHSSRYMDDVDKWTYRYYLQKSMAPRPRTSIIIDACRQRIRTVVQRAHELVVRYGARVYVVIQLLNGRFHTYNSINGEVVAT